MIKHKIDVIRDLLSKIERYNTIVLNDSLTGEALDSMKGNVKNFIREAKNELNEIKDEANSW